MIEIGYWTNSVIEVDSNRLSSNKRVEINKYIMEQKERSIGIDELRSENR